MALIIPNQPANRLVYGSTTLRNAASVKWQEGDIAIIKSGTVVHDVYKYVGDPKETAGTTSDSDWLIELRFNADHFKDTGTNHTIDWAPNADGWKGAVGNLVDLSTAGPWTDQDGTPDSKGELWAGTAADTRATNATPMRDLRVIQLSQLDNNNNQNQLILSLMDTGSLFEMTDGTNFVLASLSATPTVSSGTWTLNISQASVIDNNGSYDLGATWDIFMRPAHSGNSLVVGADIKATGDIFNDTATIVHDETERGIRLAHPSEAASNTEQRGVRPGNLRVDADTFTLSPTQPRVYGFDHVEQFQAWHVGSGLSIHNNTLGITGYDSVISLQTYRYVDQSSLDGTANGNMAISNGLARVANNTAWASGQTLSFADNDTHGNDMVAVFNDLEVGDHFMLWADNDNWMIGRITIASINDLTNYFKVANWALVESRGGYVHDATYLITFARDRHPTVYADDIVNGTITADKLVAAKGRVSSTGTITTGERLGTATWSNNSCTVTFSPAFTTAPIVQVTPEVNSATEVWTAHVQTVSTSQVVITTLNDGTRTAANFSLFAIE